MPSDRRVLGWAKGRNHGLQLTHGYGDKGAGDPIEYDHLKLILTDDTVEITVFNRGIMLFMSDDERIRRIRRIHRVLCKLKNEGEG